MKPSREQTAKEFCFSYRKSSGLTKDTIVIEARFRGYAETSGKITERMNEIQQFRCGSQPVRDRTGGSTFTNPPQDEAWRLIDRAGCRGLRIGGAVVSEKHCNFLVNTGSATAADLECLGEEVRRRVFHKTGTRLEWEIQRLGCPGRWAKSCNA